MRKLSELEGAVLGLVARIQPVTPYQLRKVFAISPNPHWSASAGSIYPLIKRLEEARLVSSVEHATGERVGQKYSITQAGRKRLRNWVLSADSVKVVGLPDLMRLRVGMLPALTPEEQREFLTSMEQKLVEVQAATREDVARKEREGDALNLLLTRGALMQTEARLNWIREVHATLVGLRRPI